MPEQSKSMQKKTLKERLHHRFYAIPQVAQWWARRTAQHTAALADLSGAIPFAVLRKPLPHCRAALLTTGGVHLSTQQPFDMENPDGDARYRAIPGDVDPANLVITHKYYDHSDADADLNVIFPLAHFRDLAAKGVIGALAPWHFGFMGHIDRGLIAVLNQKSAPEVAAKLRQDGVDFVFLTPA
jgi:D-proline reductase (dithiol) PrdB